VVCVTTLRARKLPALLVAVTLVAASVLLAPAATAAEARNELSVIVRAGSAAEAAAAVEAEGFAVERALPLVDAVHATVSVQTAARLTAAGLHVTPNRSVRLSSAAFDSDPRAAQLAALNLGATSSPTGGAGVAVAIVDTGVADVPGLEGRVMHGADLTEEADGVDRYGHGTFMAGLIVGDGSGAAPGAVVVSVKVAGADGVTSLAQVVEGIGWVVDHREELGIRVLSLSLGVDMGPGFAADPLGWAVEEAWMEGIAVVAASGNEGEGTVTSPGRDPLVITVGATDHGGTPTTTDDTVPDWSGSGRVGPVAKPELLAPGVAVTSLRAPGSTIDLTHPGARIGDDLFRGHGTSMAAALTAGATAVLAARHPEATPDDLKTALVVAADEISGEVGGAVDVAEADEVDDTAVQQWPGPHRSADEADGSPEWSGTRWSGTRWSGTRWSGTRWSGTRWTGTRWTGTRWSGTRWTAAAWGDPPA